MMLARTAAAPDSAAALRPAAAGGDRQDQGALRRPGRARRCCSRITIWPGCWRKECVFSRTTTWVFRAGPVVGVAVPVLAALLMPFGALPAPLSFTGDLILFVYLFGLARFFTVAAALDTGSSFEGMGGAREVTFSCLAEPTVLFCLIVLARLAGGLSLNALLGPHLAAAWRGRPAPPSAWCWSACWWCCWWRTPASPSTTRIPIWN